VERHHDRPRASRIERATRPSFKGQDERRANQQPYAAKQLTKPSSRGNDGARVVSTSSARDRARVERKETAVASKTAVRESRPAAKHVAVERNAKSEAKVSTREKGTKKKQAR
jgi:hypothetical protein